MTGVVRKAAYLGGSHEYTFETELGPVFVLSTGPGPALALGSTVSLQLAGHGVSVVPARPSA